jgi:uroporphyrinogen-III synthase
MTNNKLSVLITRPEKAGRVLQQHLNSIGVTAHCQPFFDYFPKDNVPQLQHILATTPQPILIFISVAAVEYAEKLLPIAQWPHHSVIAVGSATQKALQQLHIDPLVPTQHDSEGLLALAHLQDIIDRNIIIVRGDGGRELLAQQLMLRGANVQYLESYQRIWRKFSSNIISHWRQKNINCILVTSNALLQSIVHLIDNSEGYWKNDCLWIVASGRIADNAKTLGIKNIINAEGASDKIMAQVLSTVMVGIQT